MEKTYEKIKLEMEMIDEFIEVAYEAMVIVDGNGIITKFKYDKVLGIKEADAIGKHVTEIIETTRLPQVLKSGQSEIGDIQQINGHDMMTASIPIERNGIVIGAIETINPVDLSGHVQRALNKEYDGSGIQINENDTEMTIRDSLDIKHCVDEFEGKLIHEALRRTRGNKTEASKLLGLHRTALYKKMNKLGL